MGVKRPIITVDSGIPGIERALAGYGDIHAVRAEKITRQFPARDLFFLVLDLQKMVRAGIDHAKKLELRRRG